MQTAKFESQAETDDSENPEPRLMNERIILSRSAQDAKSTLTSSLTSTLLRDHRTEFDPVGSAVGYEFDREEARKAENGSVEICVQDPLSPKSMSTIPALSQSRTTPPKMFSSPRNTTSGLPPHRSMLRALASRSSTENLRSPKSPSYVSLSELANPRIPFAARFTNSPCFFHQHFDPAVNVDRVLEEIAAEDDNMSHSRLMQTATSVREISKQLQRRPIKRALRTILIVTKARDNKLVHLTRDLAEYLLLTPRYNSTLGVTVYVDAKLARSKRFDASGLIAGHPEVENMLRYWTPDLCWSCPEKFDLVLTLGGDGTVLYTSWLFQRIVPPILSFSLGSLGFLTNFSFPAYRTTLDRIMSGPGMRVNMRMRFTCTVYRSAANLPPSHSSSRSRTSSLASTATTNTSSTSTLVSSTTNTTDKSAKADSTLDLVPDTTFEVLNELVLDRGPSPYVSSLLLYSSDSLLTIIQADGCIISTPTGSTAYSLSAGGPLCHPSIPGILLTPICPHTLSFRPMVLSDTLLLRLVVPKNGRGTAYASFDGKGRVELRRGDEVRVEAGRYPFPTVVGEGGEAGEEWFDSVRRALRWNTRGVVQSGWGSRVQAGRAEPNIKRKRKQTTTKMSRDDSRVDGSPLTDDEQETLEDAEDGDRDDDGNEDDEVEEQENDEEGEGEEEDWDIDADPIEGTDSVLATNSLPANIVEGTSGDNHSSNAIAIEQASPLRSKPSLGLD